MSRNSVKFAIIFSHSICCWQVKALVQVLRREGQRKGGSMLFSYKDIAEVASLLKLKSEVSSIIDVMRTECYLLLKGPKLYQLQCE